MGADVRPVFDLALEGREWTLSLVLLVYNSGAGSSLLVLAKGTLPVIPFELATTEIYRDMAMKAAQKWLRSQTNNIDADWIS